MPEHVKVAISTDFLTSFARLPQNVQGKVSKFIANFQREPTAPSINFERIATARDPNMRSVRIDQSWRGIVLKPESGNVYMLLWVDRHDEAYAWAGRHRCQINAATGALQIYEAVTTAEVVAAAPSADAAPPLFAALRDNDLMRLGVPEDLVPVVREVRTDDDLERLERALPPEGYEGLFLIAAGDSVDRILAERETLVDAQIDTTDFTVALQTPESQARFAVVENETDLATVLNASLAQWRIFLHPSQRRLAQGIRTGPTRVLGGAGTGKTVVAMHRAKWLVENWLPVKRRILFTTFSRNLALDIHASLRELCSPETLARIEVVNLDAWARQFLQKRRFPYEVVYGTQKECWEKAIALAEPQIALPDSFYLEEWHRVIQAQAIASLDDYKKASRVGRGTVLGRTDRTRIWPVFEEYRQQLTRARKKEVDDAYRDIASLLENESPNLPYDALIVDEAQDMGPQAFRLLRAIVRTGENDLFIVGDAHQRIYGRNKVVLSKLGIDVRGRSRKLRLNYRTTEEIRRRAVAVLAGRSVDDLDGATDDHRGYRSLTHGEAPTQAVFVNADDQAAAIATIVKDRIASGRHASEVCVVARTNAEVDDIEHRLQLRGVITARIKADEADAHNRGEIRTATMHRVKGLEFDEVIVASLNAGIIPPKGSETTDPVEKRNRETEERSLIHVALTRARRKAHLFAYGIPSSLIASLQTETGPSGVSA